MAILKSVVDVNNGNTGWNNSDVLDALETVFANLGWHGGVQSSGVPQVVLSPGNRTWGSHTNFDGLWSSDRDNNFRHGQGLGSFSGSTTKSRHFNVTNNGTTAYRVLEEFRFNGNTQVNDTENSIFDDRHGIQTGDALNYAPGITSPDANYVIGGLTADTIYYAIRVDVDNFKVAANATDAANGTAIDISPATTTGYYFQRADDAAYDNYNVIAEIGDNLYFNVDDQSGGEFALCQNTTTYDANNLLTAVPRNSYGYQTQYTSITTSGTGSIRFDTNDWPQSEEVPDYAPQDAHPSWDNIGVYGYWGRTNYIYVSDTNPSMKGSITLLPRLHNRGGANHPYFKYTVPASGGRSSLILRVWFESYSYSGVGYIAGITIENIATGWTDADTFTIPASTFSGAVTPSDLNFGINTQESYSNAGDGTYSLGITNLGAGSSFFQKHYNGYYAILRNINDAAKTYGTTYYSFAMVDNTYLNINSGNDFEWANRYGTSHTDTSLSSSAPGVFRGRAGLDYQNNYNYLSRSADANWNSIQFASTSTPTAYPLQIRVYRAQAPQDTNFAIIQFCQIINGIVQPYGTISLHKGSTFGSSVFDLDYVYLDSYSEFEELTRGIQIKYRFPGYLNDGVGVEASSGFGSVANAKMRASSYGWIRDPIATAYYLESRYVCNIDTDNFTDGREIMFYYRNSAYDRNSSNIMSSEADYYKPIKGIPVCHLIVPCPYYLPDDFVLLQVSTSPGLTTFRPGDTVTVSPSEVYEVVMAGYQTSQNGLDNVNNNSSIGMLLLARTT